MALEVHRIEKQPSGPPLTADRRLYLSADRQRVLEEGDPAAAYLLAGVGGEIVPSEAARLGLAVVNGRLEQRPAFKAAEPAEDKQAEKPADKALVSAEDKGGGRKKSSFGRG